MMLPLGNSFMFLPRFSKSSNSSKECAPWVVYAHLVFLLIALVITVALCVQAYSVLAFQQYSHKQIEAANKATVEGFAEIMRDFEQYQQEHFFK